MSESKTLDGILHDYGIAARIHQDRINDDFKNLKDHDKKLIEKFTEAKSAILQLIKDHDEVVIGEAEAVYVNSFGVPNDTQSLLGMAVNERLTDQHARAAQDRKERFGDE